jgi:DNA-directed RNA polymerase specialized sigma24 family protein
MQTFDPESIMTAAQYYNSSEHLDDLLERARRSRVSARSIEVLRELGASSLAEMAQHHGLSLRAARRRRQLAISELRARTLSAA